MALADLGTLVHLVVQMFLDIHGHLFHLEHSCNTVNLQMKRSPTVVIYIYCSNFIQMEIVKLYNTKSSRTNAFVLTSGITSVVKVFRSRETWFSRETLQEHSCK